VILSRGDLFNKANEDAKTAIFSIIFWGYPRNMRGNTFKSILGALPDIEKMLSGSRELDSDGYSQICLQLKGKGIGLSTLSKFLYFFGFRIEGFRCLILDSRIIEVLNTKTFDELALEGTIKEWNKEDHYLGYLKLMADVARKNEYSVDQLELFLFQFGRNLKTAHA
jgi:thermostable 8-oxoguanine DNA glycosylase